MAKYNKQEEENFAHAEMKTLLHDKSSPVWDDTGFDHAAAVIKDFEDNEIRMMFFQASKVVDGWGYTLHYKKDEYGTPVVSIYLCDIFNNAVIRPIWQDDINVPSVSKLLRHVVLNIGEDLLESGFIPAK